MFKTIRSRWMFKILAAFTAVVLLAGAIHALAMNLSIAAAFDRHVGRMGENMQSMMGGSGARGMSLYENFQAAVNESMWISALAALAISLIAALLISRLITRPIQRLAHASRQIAKGDYTHRIPAGEIPHDELGLLADQFNQMAEKLENIESMRKQLIGDISHELRTPLTAIKGSM